MAPKSLSKFNRRHYEAVARAMQSALLDRSAYAAVRELADMFAKDNSAFDRDRFIQACEPGANLKARKLIGQLPSNEWRAR
jgi:hypothetical protein